MARQRTRHPVGAAADLPLNQIRCLEVGGRSIGVVRTPEAIYAFRNLCPHQGAPICKGYFGGTLLPSAPDNLEFGLENRVLRCQWHLWEFDLATGEALFGISSKRLVTYPVEVENGQVAVLLPSP